MYNPMRRTEEFETIKSELTSIICSQNFNFGVQLIFNSSFKVVKNIQNIRLVF